MTGRVRVFASFLTVATVAATLLLAIPVGTQAIPLLTEAVGETAVLWNTPDIAVPNVLVRVDVEDPLGAQASDTRTVSLTLQSPVALIIAVLIVLVLFLLFGFLRARK